MTKLQPRDPETWRNCAKWARLEAEHLQDPTAKEHQLKMAETHERLARYAEERIAAAPGAEDVPRKE